MRVPGLVISPYARQGYIDHQQLSFDAYLKFIEDDFLCGQRLNPKTDGRPDSRPTVRESAAGLGNLRSDFDFAQKPRAPLVLQCSLARRWSHLLGRLQPPSLHHSATRAIGALTDRVIAAGRSEASREGQHPDELTEPRRSADH